MQVIVCLEDRGGMLFNGRRVSRDKTVIQKVIELSEGKRLWIHPFSTKLFGDELPEGICVDENFLKLAEKGEFCFVENQALQEVEERIEDVIVFWWNRKYPFDFKLDLDLDKLGKMTEEEFAGFSHEKITMTKYEKRKQ